MTLRNLITINEVSKKFQTGHNVFSALECVNMSVQRQEFLAIAGTSGSGKTTLLNLIGALDRPTSGQILFDGQDVNQMNSDQVARLRAERIGFIFQTFNLLPVLTALENVEYPLGILRFPAPERRRAAEIALERVGLSHVAHHLPAELSGGQRQRVAIARALVKKPELILADEPTANLDSRTTEEVLSLMRQLNLEEGITFVFTSHDPLLYSRATRVVQMQDGRIQKISLPKLQLVDKLHAS